MFSLQKVKERNSNHKNWLFGSINWSKSTKTKISSFSNVNSSANYPSTFDSNDMYVFNLTIIKTTYQLAFGVGFGQVPFGNGKF